VARAISEKTPRLGRQEPREVTVRVSTTIVVPALNEEQGIGVVLQKIVSEVDDTYEILVVDGASTDGTRVVAGDFPCRVVVEPKRGKGVAIRRALAEARGENIIFIDADDTYPAEVIPEIARGLEECDAVWTSRVNGREHIPRFNRLGNAMLSSLHRGLFGFPGSDPSSGLYGVKKHLLEAMSLRSTGFEIEQEIAAHVAGMRLRFLEIPIEYRPRLGEPKLSGLRHGWRHGLPLIRLLPRYRLRMVSVFVGVALASSVVLFSLSRRKRP
jgi:glycosyltransferase involved in cell wall biosynthesis